jgi:hypothetical protein
MIKRKKLVYLLHSYLMDNIRELKYNVIDLTQNTTSREDERLTTFLASLKTSLGDQVKLIDEFQKQTIPPPTKQTDYYRYGVFH